MTKAGPRHRQAGGPYTRRRVVAVLTSRPHVVGHDARFTQPANEENVSCTGELEVPMGSVVERAYHSCSAQCDKVEGAPAEPEVPLVAEPVARRGPGLP